MPFAKAPRLLVVDDDETNLDLLTRLLETEYTVVCVNNGIKALNILEEAYFDLVLLDIMMPEMNGFEVLKAIRETYDTTALPVILISALQMGSDIVRGLKTGANDYITKPFDMAVVLMRIRTQVERKMLMDERQKTIEELEEANTLKEHFMRIASHDLKNPLSNLQTVVSLMRDFVGGDQEMNTIIDVADASITLMLDIVEQFLESAVIRDSKVKLDIQPVDVDEIIQLVQSEYAAVARGKRITVEIESIAAYVMADPNRLHQMLANLVSNAIKYSPPETQVTVYGKQLDGALQIHVLDEGPGIPEKERHVLFQPFGKLTPRPTAGESSTGLGLWIVKQLANLQHGDVNVSNPESGGSDFWIQLPLADENDTGA